MIIQTIQNHKNKLQSPIFYWALCYKPIFTNMKKIILSLAMLATVATFAQKDELKVLKRFDNMQSQPSQNDMDKLSNALSVLDTKVDVLSDEDKVLYHYFKVSQPIMEVMMVSMKNPSDVAAIQKASEKYNNPNFLESLSNHYKTMVDLEKKIGKKEYTDDIKPIMDMMKQQMTQAAFKLNTDKKYKEASDAFYALYKFDKSNGSNLENAAILASQSGDYKLAEKLYEEYANSDYLNNGIIYYAISKVSGAEEIMANRDERVKMIAMGTHEKPRDEKVALKKPEVYKNLAIVTSQNGDVEKSKKAYDKALELNPKDADVIEGAFIVYFNSGYNKLKDDQNLVDELNANLDNKTKYDELMLKRKEMFKNALPDFEKAYQLKRNDQNTKQLLKMSYDMLDMKDKAAMIK